MEQKFKLRDAAKELEVEASEIVAIVKDFFGTEKKSAGTLALDEFNVVLEKVLLSKATSSVEDYFATKPAKSDKGEAAQKPKLKPRAEKPVKADKAAVVSKAVKAVAEKLAKPAASAKVGGKSEGGGGSERRAVSAGAKSAGVRPAPKKPSMPIGDMNPMYGRPGVPSRPPKPQTAVPAEPAAASEAAAVQRKEVTPLVPREVVKQAQPAKAPKVKMTPKEVKAAVDISTLKVNEPPKAKQKGEAVQRGEQIVKRVDTRGNYVELDRYNEKYESIAAAAGQSAQYGNNNARPGGRGSQFANTNTRGKQKFGGGGRPGQRGGRGNMNQPVRKAPETPAQRAMRLELEKARNKQLEVLIPDAIVVSELASRLKTKASEVIKRLMPLGIMANQNQTIDYDTAALIAEELGAKVEREVIVTVEERLFAEVEIEDTDENLLPRSPVVVVMGHVDHGKTSLLDAIRDSDVASGEAGGITQHIGAHRVRTGENKDKKITFLDTPGHEAFTSMRARGANITDIAILVVAADDGIMPQTIESINHAKAANVAIIVAINKIDKEEANPTRIKQELTEHGLVIEDWGGDIICCEVSAKKRIGIDNLLEMVNITAEVLELKANPNRLAAGTVIEARLDKGRGPVATLLVQKGTLNTGDVLIAGTSVGRVRVMTDDKGKTVKTAGPSVPVEITGLAEVPSAGDLFSAVADEKLARELVEQRKHEAKEVQFNQFKKVTLDNLFSHIEEGSVKELPIIVKADVQGSVEAVKQSLEKLSVEEVKIRVIHGGVGAISESDVMLANASGAIIVGFNVRPHPAAAENAKKDNVEIRTYRIIYDAIEEIETAMKGMLAPKFKEVEMARIEVRQVYKITGAGTVAGCYVLDGKVNRTCEIRVVRDGIVVYEDKINTLKRFKDDVKEVAHGYECGITLERFSDIKENDIFEAFIMEQIAVS
ncbi:MAG: translation initiation factor IF-2 [Oscillospiraceae bacterium]|nr:translation initiation factor IF-2 [Oscillospiraceae bacterium]